MTMKSYLLGAAVAVAAGLPLLPVGASAADGIYVPLFSYRTGPFAGSGTPIVNGMADYLNMLNERDGGIGGVKLIVEECETGYDTKKGLECYEQVKSKNPVLTNPYSTGITLPLIGKALSQSVSAFRRFQANYTSIVAHFEKIEEKGRREMGSAGGGGRFGLAYFDDACIGRYVDEAVQAAHRAGIQVVPWTANSPGQWRMLVNAQVDAIISDDPAELIVWLKAAGLR